MLAYGTCEISIRPEFSSPQLLLHLWTSHEYFACCKALDHPDNPCHTLRRHCLHQTMHMILICADLQELHLIPTLQLNAHVPQLLIHFFVEDGTSLLCWKNQMVYQDGNIMTLMDVLTHISILRRKRRGIYPGEIEQKIDKLYQMKLGAMADGLRQQMNNSKYAQLSFEDRFSLLVDRQLDEKESRGLMRRLQVAKLKQPATVEDIDFASPRGLDRAALLSLRVRICFVASQHHHNRPDRCRQDLYRLRHRQPGLPDETLRQILQDRQPAFEHSSCQGRRHLPLPCPQTGADRSPGP